MSVSQPLACRPAGRDNHSRPTLPLPRSVFPSRRGPAMRPSRFSLFRPGLTAALLLAAATVAVRGQAPPPTAPATEADPAAGALDKKLIAQAKDGSEVMTNLTYLSDVIGPRLTGSENLKRANEWAAEKMKSYGLSNVR